MVDITVRAATKADVDAIFDFVHRAYAGRSEYKIPDRWKWQFEDNPFVESGKLPIWIALDRERVIGQTCAQVEPLKLGETVTRVGWSVDTHVLAEYRGQGIGQRLQAANQASHPVFMSIGMSESNRRIKQRLGGCELEPLWVFRKRFGIAANAVLRRIRAQAIQRLATTLHLDRGVEAITRLFYGADWSRQGRVARQRSQRLELEQVDRFDSKITEFWKQASDGIDISVERSAEYLNWKFCEQPFMNHDKFVARLAGKLCGYFVVRNCTPPEPAYGIIADIVACPLDKELLSELIVRATDHLLGQGAIAVKAAASQPQMIEAFRDLGFSGKPERIPVCYIAECLQPPTTSADVFLSYGDHDLDQFPLAGRR